MVNQAATGRRGPFRGRFRAGVAACAVGLAGCADPGRVGNPLDWWHGLEGGRIAEQRPPPPGATDPFPNLDRVPARPVIPDMPARQQLSATLAAQRDRQAEMVAADPLPNAAPAPARPAARPAPAAEGSFEAATPAPAPVPAKAAPTPAPIAAQPAPAASAPAAALPSLAETPPLPPVLPGLSVPVSPPTQASRPVAASTEVPIGFPAGSDALPATALPALRAVAGRRGSHPLGVVGQGEGDGSLDLALRRAQAVAAALVAAGVPPAAIRLSADAAGRGARVRLLD